MAAASSGGLDEDSHAHNEGDAAKGQLSRSAPAQAEQRILHLPISAAHAARISQLFVHRERSTNVTHRLVRRTLCAVVLIAGTIPAFTACASRTTSMNQTKLTDIGNRYAAAWSSQNPVSLASFYTENGSLTVNGSDPSVGRTAITETARGFMTAFPDMVVKMDEVSQNGSHATFRWTWTGTNTGPGGTGKSVRIRGYEEWAMSADGLIAASKGHFDEAEYQRQLKSGVPADR
jgi:uncharacterized protein (TIGR02246 family)